MAHRSRNLWSTARIVGSRFRARRVKRVCTRSPAFRRREIGRLETHCPCVRTRNEKTRSSEDEKSWFRFFRFFVLCASCLRAFAPLVFSPAMSRPPPRAPAGAYHAARPRRRRLDVSVLRSQRSETKRATAEAGVHPMFIFTPWLRVAAPAAAPARAFPPYPRARRRPAPSSCPPPGRPRPSARR